MTTDFGFSYKQKVTHEILGPDKQQLLSADGKKKSTFTLVNPKSKKMRDYYERLQQEELQQAAETNGDVVEDDEAVIFRRARALVEQIDNINCYNADGEFMEGLAKMPPDELTEFLLDDDNAWLLMQIFERRELRFFAQRKVAGKPKRSQKTS